MADHMCIVTGLVDRGSGQSAEEGLSGRVGYYGPDRPFTWVGRDIKSMSGTDVTSFYQEAIMKLPREDLDAFHQDIHIFASEKHWMKDEQFQWPDNDYILLGVFNIPHRRQRDEAASGPFHEDLNRCILGRISPVPKTSTFLLRKIAAGSYFSRVREVLELGASWPSTAVVTPTLPLFPPGGFPSLRGIDASFPNVAMISLAYRYLEHWLQSLGLRPSPMGFARELYAVINHSDIHWQHRSQRTGLYKLLAGRRPAAADDTSYGLEEFEHYQADWKVRNNTLNKTYAAWKAGMRGVDLRQPLYADSGAWMGMCPNQWPRPDQSHCTFAFVDKGSRLTMDGHEISQNRLPPLPMDVFLEIIDQLDSMRDICNALRTCRYYRSGRHEAFRSLFTRRETALQWIFPAKTVPNEEERFNDVVLAWWRWANGDTAVDVASRSDWLYEETFPHYDFGVACLNYLPLWNRERLFKIAKQYLKLFYEYRTAGLSDNPPYRFVDRATLRALMSPQHHTIIFTGPMGLPDDDDGFAVLPPAMFYA